MSDYTKSINFTAKDSLPPGDAAKVIRGTEFDTEFNALAVAVNSKSNLASPSFTGTVTLPGYTETVFALSGTTPSISAANGTIQTWTLTGASTPTDGLLSGQSVLLMIDDGTANTITWTMVDVWTTGGGVAPTLKTTGYTHVLLWKVSTVVYGALIGDPA